MNALKKALTDVDGLRAELAKVQHERDEARLREKAAEDQLAKARAALHTIRDTFLRDEADGYRSRDRRFAMEIAGSALKTEGES